MRLWRPPRGSATAGLAAATFGVFYTALDQTVVVTAMPDIVFDLGLDFQDIDRAAWIVTGFLIGYAVVLPISGRLADRHSKRAVYLTALAVFAVASLLAAVSSNLWFLVAARVVQAAGGGALVPVALACAADEYGGRARLIALGIVVAAAEAGGVLGPLWGAVITHFLSWRWIFYLNLPIAAVIGGAVWWTARWGIRHPGRHDWRGAIFAATGLTLFIVGLARDQVLPGGASGALLVAGIVALAGFVVLELGVAAPLLDVRLFRRRAFALGNLAAALVGGGLIIPMVNVPLFAATVLGGDALAGGLLLLKMTALIPLGALAGAVLAARAGARPTIVLGVLAAALGLWGAAGWPADPGDGRLTRDLMLAGFGFGLWLAPLTAAVMGAAGSANFGMAAGLVTVSRLIGMMAALASLTPWALDRLKAALAPVPLPIGRGGETAEALARLTAEYERAVTEATVAMFNDLFAVSAILCAVAAIPVLFLVQDRPSKVSTAAAN